MSKKRFIASLAGGLALLAGAGLLLFQGLVFPVRVAGGSMAETLFGAHYEVVCDDCEFPFRWGTDQRPPAGSAVCPNCGYRRNELNSRRLRPGTRIGINRLAMAFSSPRRWDLVAIRGPDDKLAVKRVVALPHEDFAIRAGDLYVNGRIARKTLHELRRQAVVVHHDDYRPRRSGTLPARWRSEAEPSRWRAIEEGFLFELDGTSHEDPPTAENAPPADWLTYHHWRCYRAPAARSDEVPISDNYGYNQGVSRVLREVVDLLLSFQVRVEHDGTLTLRLHDGREDFLVRLDYGGQTISVHRDRSVFARVTTQQLIRGKTLQVEAGLFDQQAVVAVDGQVVLRQPYRPAARPSRPLARPLAIRAADARIELRHLKIYRDTYYLDPDGLGIDWGLERSLGENEYLVLGDNPPVSTDSRHWPRAALPRDQMVGRVLLPWRRP